MTKLEQYIESKGYIKYAYNSKEKTYYKPKTHVISTAVNLAHYYIHNTETKVLNKIKQDLPINDNDFVNTKMIIVGLAFAGLPPVLISPLPKVRLKTLVTINEKPYQIILSEGHSQCTTAMMQEEPKNILKGIYDDSIVFEYDKT